MYVGRLTLVGTRKRGCTYCDWGVVCEEIDTSWVAENKVVCTVSGMRIWGDQRQLGYEKEAVCILWGGVCGDLETDAGWVAENKEVCTVSGMRIWED